MAQPAADISPDTLRLQCTSLKILATARLKDDGDVTVHDDLMSAVATIEAMAARINELERKNSTIRGVTPELPQRMRMSPTRPAINHTFHIGERKGYLVVGMFEDGRPGELFIHMDKEGSTIGGLLDAVATLASIALQYHVPIDSLVRKFAYQRFEPSGYTHHPDVRHAYSVIDYVFRWMGCQFIKGYKEAMSGKTGDADTGLIDAEVGVGGS